MRHVKSVTNNCAVRLPYKEHCAAKMNDRILFVCVCVSASVRACLCLWFFFSFFFLFFLHRRALSFVASVRTARTDTRHNNTVQSFFNTAVGPLPCIPPAIPIAKTRHQLTARRLVIVANGHQQQRRQGT